MTTIFLVFLFITQIVSFYFIALLYMKLSKFEDLEKKQNKLMKEMDDSIAAYLAEIKDENDKLIEKLSSKTTDVKQAIIEPVKKTGRKMESQHEDTPSPIAITMPNNTMRHHARQSYEAVKQKAVHEDIEVDDKTRAIQLYKDGMSIEEIAKALEKGKTEIELMLKFK